MIDYVKFWAAKVLFDVLLVVGFVVLVTAIIFVIAFAQSLERWWRARKTQ